jgi:hypothetical protein
LAEEKPRSLIVGDSFKRRVALCEAVRRAALSPRCSDSINPSYITGTDIVVDGGWFSSAPYLANERSHHMLHLLDTKDKARHLMDDFLKHFR